MGVDLHFYLRAWKKDGEEIKIQDYVDLMGEQKSLLSVHDKYTSMAFIHDSDYAYRQVDKTVLNDWVRKSIAELIEDENNDTEEERLNKLFPGEFLYQVNLNEIIKAKWLSQHVDGYITSDEYAFEEYEEEGLEKNCISTWYMEDEIDTSSSRFVHVSFDVTDPFAVKRAKLIEEFLRVQKTLKEKADLDEESIQLYMYYNN